MAHKYSAVNLRAVLTGNPARRIARKDDVKQADTYELVSATADDDDDERFVASHSPAGVISSRDRWKTWQQRLTILHNARYFRIPKHRFSSKPLFNGWRFGALVSLMLVGIVLIFNLSFALFAMNRLPSKNGLGSLGKGPCKTILSRSTWIHLAINICSTILVGASNFNMQCLTAPTRRIINEAHRNKKSIDIGIHAIQNLSTGPMWKTILWGVLLISTLPLHLLWNSAVFPIAIMNQYSVTVATPELLTAADIGIDCGHEAMARYQTMSYLDNIDQQNETAIELHAICSTFIQAKNGKLHKLSPPDCMARYTRKLQASSFNLIAMTDGKSNSSFRFASVAARPVLAYLNSANFERQLKEWCQGQCPEDWCNINTCGDTWLQALGSECIVGTDSRHEISNTADCRDKFVGDSHLWCRGTLAENVPYSCYEYATGKKILSGPSSVQAFSEWLCQLSNTFGECSIKSALAHSNPWYILPEGYEIDHCLVSDAPDFACELQYSSTILYAVLACNFAKFFAILLHLIFSTQPTFMTTGDAISSFLDEPDPTTKGKCLSVCHSVKYQQVTEWVGDSQWEPRIWQTRKRRQVRLHDVNTGREWVIFGLCWSGTLVLAMFTVPAEEFLTLRQKLLSQGFGAGHIESVMSVSEHRGGSEAAILTSALVVNSPQVLFSSLYFLYNALFTRMAAACEWAKFSQQRRSLRVTTPRGSQRSTYWLQLPFRFAVPLLSISTLQHWLISQTIFLLNFRVLTPSERFIKQTIGSHAGNTDVVTGLGFSALGFVLSIGLHITMLLCIMIVSMKPSSSEIIVVGSDSRAISAACHAGPNDEDAAARFLLWGARKHQDGLKPGHCCLSSYNVEKPRDGGVYA